MKFWDNILQRITRLQSVCGVDAHLLDDGSVRYAAVKLVLKKGKVTASEHRSHIGSRAKLWEFIGTDPVVMTFNGKGILLRSTQEKIASTPEIIHRFLPSVNAQEFFVTTEQYSGKYHYYIARKTLLEEELLAWKKAGQTQLLSLNIGTASLQNVFPFIEGALDRISLPSLEVVVEKGSIIEIITGGVQQDILEEHVKIDGNYYSSSLLPAFGNGLSIISKVSTELTAGFKAKLLVDNRNQYYYKKLFVLSGWSFLSLLLVLLMVNYFVFSSYYGQTQQLEQQKQELVASSQDMEKIRSSMDSGFNALSAKGWDKSTRNSFYADRIAALVPATISLSSISVQPKQEDQDFHGFLFNTEKISVAGISQEPEDLTMFLASLKNIPGVHSVKLTSYLYKNELAASLFVLDLSIAKQ